MWCIIITFCSQRKRAQRKSDGVSCCCFWRCRRLAPQFGPKNQDDQPPAASRASSEGVRTRLQKSATSEANIITGAVSHKPARHRFHLEHVFATPPTPTPTPFSLSLGPSRRPPPPSSGKLDGLAEHRAAYSLAPATSCCIVPLARPRLSGPFNLLGAPTAPIAIAPNARLQTPR